MLSQNGYRIWAALIAAVVATLAASTIVGPLPTLFVLGPLLVPAVLGLDPVRFAMVLGIATSLGLLVPPMGPIFATLAAGTTEPSSRVALGIGYFALAGFVVLGMALFAPLWQPSRRWSNPELTAHTRSA